MVVIVAPLLIAIPLYILGRKIFFKNVPQVEMHTIKSGKIFTLSIASIYMVLMVLLYAFFYF
jgi:hypothetical protein